MKFLALTPILCSVAAVLAAPSPRALPTANVTYDTVYDNALGDLMTVSCSNGPNGMVTRGYTTFGSLPNFPRIGGAQGVSWGSSQCGSCWKLTFNGTSINVLAIDYAKSGFNIALSAMQTLTRGNGQFLGHVLATYEQVPASQCGLTA